MPEAFQYVRELADEIGPRPATTDAEAEAADYIEDVMRSRGLDVERQEFVSPRTYSWAYVGYHLLTVAAAFASGFMPVLAWPAFAVAAISAFLMFMDLDTRFGLSSIMPKGPSQNVIARHVPRARRGERLRRVVIVAHYDSAKASLAFSPGMVKNFELTFGLMKGITFAVPVLVLVAAVPWSEPLDPWLWYATMAVSAYLLVPLLINIHRELFMHAVDGANDNASGVAAMLGVMDAIIPASEADVTAATQPLRRVPQRTSADETAAPTRPAPETEYVEEGGLLAYAPAGGQESEVTELPDDFQWAQTPGPAEGQASFELDTVEFEPVTRTRESMGRSAPAEPPAAEPPAAEPPPAPTAFVEPASVEPTRERPSLTGSWGDVETDFDADGVPDLAEADYDDEQKRRELFGMPEGDSPEPARARVREPERKRPGLWSRIRGRDKGEGAGVSSWLGVGRDFDARKEGRDIGSWENFEEEDDDFGFKGGWAGDDPIGDPDFARNEATRIRKRVTESIDRALSEKEVWFVATGAEEVGTVGMKAFLGQYADDLRGALIINLDNLGAGTLHWVTEEGMVRRYHCDRRLASAARRVAYEEELPVRGRPYRGLSTDATPALARGYKAISIMAFDINERLPNWHWRTDTSDNVRPENIENAVRLVKGIVRES